MTALDAPLAEITLGAALQQLHLQVGSFNIRYSSAGQGQPLVVIHGAGGPVFTRALDSLAAGRQVILLELPDWGDTENQTHRSLAELAGFVVQTLDALRLPAVDVLGTSMGGAVALHLALDHAERVNTLVLDEPAAFRVGARSPVDMAPADLVRSFRSYPERTPAFTAPDPAAVARSWPVVERVLASTPDFDAGLAARLESCTTRTLVLFGDRDGVVPPENGRTYRRHMPNCSLVLVHRAAHDIQGDRPEAFSDVVGDFSDRGWQFLLSETPTLINPDPSHPTSKPHPTDRLESTMYVQIDLAPLPPSVALKDPEDFTGFSVQVAVPPHIWVKPDMLVALAGRGDDPAWRAELAAMTTYAASKGWVDGDGRIRAHVTVIAPPADGT